MTDRSSLRMPVVTVPDATPHGELPMSVAATLVTVLLGALLALAAIRKLSHREQVVQSYARAGVPEDKLDYLAVVLLAGATGLLAGLVWAPIGIAAAIGVICYFAVAVAFHIRAGDTKRLATPVTLAVVAAVALVLRLAAL